MKQFKLFLIFLLVATATFSQNKNIRGFVYDAKNGEPLPFEKVRLLKSDNSVLTGASTDENGFFQIVTEATGEHFVSINTGVHEEVRESIQLSDSQKIYNLEFLLKVKENIQKIDQVTVSAESKQKKNQVLISELKLNKKQIERIPSIGAENDISGAFSITPGVTVTGDQGGQFYVRGGTPIQNKILLDGMTIYSPFHSIGFFSVFETELIQNTKILTGGFDAEYGGRISSVMDITYRDGNRKKLGGKVSVSPFMAKAVLEGPLGKVKDGKPKNGSFILSAKQSLIPYTSKMYRNVNRGEGMPFHFTDVYGKITFKGKTGSKFSAFGFHNRDSVNYNIADLNWQSSGGGINFTLVPANSSIFIKGHVTGSGYKTSFSEDNQPERISSIGGFDMGFDFTNFLKNESEVNFGFNFNGQQVNFETYNSVGRKIGLTDFVTEVGAYTSYRLVRTRIVIQPSFRVQYYPTVNTFSPEPRLGIKVNASDNFRIKMSGGRFSQNFTSASSDKDVVNLFNGLLSAPTSVQEEFLQENGKVKRIKNGIQTSWHAIGGFEFDIVKNLSLNIEGYFKWFDKLSNINHYKNKEDNSDNHNYPDIEKKDFLIESGKSFGVDVLLKYNTDRIYLWGVYSFGKSNRWDGIMSYAPVFDRRHNINLVGTYLLGKKKDIELSLRWNLGSGLPFTPTAGFYQAEDFGGGVTTDYTTTNPDEVTTLLGTFNSGRLPYYHRLDFTAKKRFIMKNESVLELVASVTNLYNRKNIFYVNRVTNKVIHQFPILPSFGLSYKF